MSIFVSGFVCPGCGTGAVEAVTSDSDRLMLLCPLGGEVWLHPDHLASGPMFYVDRDYGDLTYGVIVDPMGMSAASWGDIGAAGWDRVLFREGRDGE